MKIVTRKNLGWPATPAASAPCKSGLVIHYDGAKTPKGVAAWEHEQCLAYWHWCRRFHTQSNGWLDIGYSYGCCPHGQILEGRGWGREQAAQPGGNRDWTSVTLMLGDGEDPTPAQIEGIRELRAHLRKKGMGAAVRGHRDFVATSCPGARLYARLDDFRKDPTPDEAPEKKEADMKPQDIYNAVWERDAMEAPDGNPSGKNPHWRPSSVLTAIDKRSRATAAKVDAIAADNKILRAQLAEVLELLRGQAETAYDAGAAAGAEKARG